MASLPLDKLYHGTVANIGVGVEIEFSVLLSPAVFPPLVEGSEPVLLHVRQIIIVDVQRVQGRRI